MSEVTFNDSYIGDRGSLEKMLSKCNSLVIISRTKPTSNNNLKGLKGSFPNCLHLVGHEKYDKSRTTDWSQAFNLKKSLKTVAKDSEMYPAQTQTFGANRFDENLFIKRERLSDDMMHPYHSESLEELNITNNKSGEIKICNKLNWDIDEFLSKRAPAGKLLSCSDGVPSVSFD